MLNLNKKITTILLESSKLVVILSLKQLLKNQLFLI
ncbi:hypothetical protein SAMN05444395_10259 [Flavobacterium fryxellicola]|nr:hypothetical protein SAMN05444395_10259 [Flavobacterium fryxellicola]